MLLVFVVLVLALVSMVVDVAMRFKMMTMRFLVCVISWVFLMLDQT